MEGLLSVSFGTSYEETRIKTIDAIEKGLRAAFPERAFYSAWTSGRIIEKVKAERGEHHDTLEQAFERLTADGIDDVVVSTTCLMQGGEMAKVAKATQEWGSGGGRTACMAAPLLSSAEDRRSVARIIRDQFSLMVGKDALLLMGHGSPVGSNQVYRDLQDDLRSLGCTRFFVATVEGEPTFDDALPLIQASKAKRVVLAPLMIVAGDHACNDLAGDSEDSWANRLRASGFEAEAVLKGLGEYEGIHQLVCDHVRDALILQEVSLRG